MVFATNIELYKLQKNQLRMNAGVSHPSVTFLWNVVAVFPDCHLTGYSQGFL